MLKEGIGSLLAKSAKCWSFTKSSKPSKFEHLFFNSVSFADPLARVFRDGVRSRRRPDDAHSRRRLLRAQGRLLHRMRRPGTAVLARKQNHLQVGQPSFQCTTTVQVSFIFIHHLYHMSVPRILHTTSTELIE